MAEASYAVGFKIGYTCLFVMASIACVAVNAYIFQTFEKFRKHRAYLLYFNFTIAGLLLLIFDRIADIWTIWSYNYWNWWCYVFGQNLLVSGELVRAIRLTLVVYIGKSNIKARKLTTRAMVMGLAILQLPVLIFYILLGKTQNETFDYLCVAYYCLQLIFLIVATILLWRKRRILRRHLLSETRVIAIFSAILALLVVWDNVRYYGFQEDAYGHVAENWAYVDMATLIVCTVLVYWIWNSHITITHTRDFGSRASTLATSDLIEDTLNKPASQS